MCDGIVIDGHIMRAFKGELVQKNGTIYSLVFWITSNCGIAITNYIKTHWEQQCGTRAKNLLFWEWYFDQLHNKHTIHFIKVRRLRGTTWESIRATYRIPQDPFVRSAIECANSTSEPRYILAEDMFFYDPTAKRIDPDTQRSIREDRTGIVSKFLEQHYCIMVGTPNHCRRYFAVDYGACQNKSLNDRNDCPRVISC